MELYEKATRPVDHVVIQVFCASVPIVYQEFPADAWKELVTVISQGAFDYTLRSAAKNAGASGARVGRQSVRACRCKAGLHRCCAFAASGLPDVVGA